ncbi:hypothetical protein ACET3Z_018315 [Daucus carota]
MDVGRSGPGPLDGSLLTLQSVHRSQVMWNNIEVWIYERFPSLAPRHRGQPLFEYPLALRWKAPLRHCEVPHAQSRMTQYELDALTPRQFRWRPYADLPAEHHPEATVRSSYSMQRAIDPYAPDLGLANHILQDMVTRVQRRPTEQAPARPRARAPAGRRGRPPVTPVVPEEGTYYTHVGSSHLAGTSHSAGHDGAGTFEAGGWSPFIQPSTSEGGAWPQFSRLGDDEAQDDEGPSQDHLSESYVYRPDMSFLEDHTPPPFTQEPSFGSSTYRFGSPPVTFTPMMSTSGEGFTTPLPAFAAFAGDSSPWAYAPVRPPRAAAQPSEVEDESDHEEPSEHEQRQQPPRAAKGKGRRCHTGSHFFGHTKK